MPINPYINFNGNCREAAEFYADAFGAEPPVIMTFGSSPQDPNHPIPPEAKDLVMHTQIMVQGTPIMCSDVFPGHPYSLGNNISLTVTSKNSEDIKDYYHKLKEGGTVHMELQKTFWSNCYANLTDKFGIGWQLSQESEPHS
jgi:PhnB protein